MVFWLTCLLCNPFQKKHSTKKEDCSDRKLLTKVTFGSKFFIAEKTTRLQEVNQNFTCTWQPGVKWYVVFFSSFPWVYSFGQLSFYDDTQARDSNVSLTKLQHQAGKTHTIILNIAIAHCLLQDLVEILLKYHHKDLFIGDDSVIPRFIEPCRQGQETCDNWNS